MKRDLQHIVFVDADSESQKKFNAHFSLGQVQITNFNTAPAVIQFIKQTDRPDVLIIEENIKPLGAIQTLNYLNDQLNYNGCVFILSETAEELITDTKVYEVIQKPIDNKGFTKISDCLEKLISSKSDTTKAEIEKRYSLTYLDNLSDGDQSFITESVKIFIDTVSIRITELVTLIAQKSFEEVSSIAHNIKPSFEMIENVEGLKICDKLAHHAQEHEMSKLVSALKAEYDIIESQIQLDFPELYSKT